MTQPSALTFVVVANDLEILRNNLLASPCLQGHHPHQVIVQQRFTSAAGAFNAALSQSCNDVVAFIHQDVYLPEGWLSDIEYTLQLMAALDPNWGVLGCWGVKRSGQGIGYLYTPGQEVIGGPQNLPDAVQTLDEVVLILRKSSGLTFNEALSGFHFYGADICLAAAKLRLRSYAISAFCIHNSRQHFRLPRDFYACYRQIKRLRREFLPIQTSCVRITRFNRYMWWRRIKETFYWLRPGAHQEELGTRATDPLTILRHLHLKEQVWSTGSLIR